MYPYDYDYEGAHSITFWPIMYNSSGKRTGLYGSSNSWEDFELIPLSRPYIALPTANYSMVQIPGTSVRLDLTNYIPGGKTYNSRTGSWSFAAPVTKDHKEWNERYRELKQFFDGDRFAIRLEDDPEHYYEGRVTVTSYTPGDAYSTVGIDYDIDPLSRDTLGIQ